MDSKFIHTLIASLLLFLAVNIVLLDIVVFSSSQKKEPVATVIQEVKSVSSCDESCRSSIVAEVSKQIAQAEPKSAKSNIKVTASSNTSPKEFFVPLGSGTTKNDQWEEIAGAQATIDTSLYPAIKKVTFEANLKLTPGIGTLQVKLFNATDKHDVWFSEVTSESDQSIRREAIITLDHGSKQYQVHAKSSLRAVAAIDNARIRIVTQ